MNFLIYSVYDKRAEIFAQPFLSHNDSTAVRQFNYSLQSAEMVAKDSALYCIGKFDSVSGEITLNDNHIPRFVANYGEVIGNE